MQHFQSILIVIGILAILAVLVHGFFLSKKNKSCDSDNSNDSDLSGSNPIEMNASFRSDLKFEPDDFESSTESKIDFSDDQEDPTLKFDERDNDTLFKINDPTDLADEQSVTENIEIESIEPILNADEPIIEPIENLDEAPMFKELDLNGVEKMPDVKESEPVQEKEDIAKSSELFIFNVVAKDGKVLYGHDLLQFFVSAGLRFGEMSIFHRHEESSGNGEVLFSVANMMAPGTFELNTIEKLETEGISFFMSAPNKKIDLQQAFDLMLVCITNLAEEFDCMVLNADRELLTEDQFGKDKLRLSKFH